MPQLIGDEFSGSRARAAPVARPPKAPYNRGNALVVVAAKIAVSEREELERLAVAGEKSVSAVVREAIQRHIRPERPRVLFPAQPGVARFHLSRVKR